MSEDDIAEWCDDHLPDFYNEGMFDDEDTSEEVWDGVQALATETILEFMEDEDERDATEEALMDAARTWFREHHDQLIEALPSVDAATLAALCNKPQVDQHSAEWYEQRRNRLTASEFANILDGRRGSLLRSKLDPAASHDRPTKAPVAIAQEDGEMNATSWGHRFEPVTRDIYELELAGVHTVNDSLGRFTHATIPWLSASPDGLVTHGALAGRLVEIKSPKTRQPGDFVPSDYYVQMQIQMEVCNLDAVDFVEAQYKQIPLQFGTRDYSGDEPAYTLTPRRFLSDDELAVVEAARWKGRIEVYGYHDEPDTWVYRYTAPVEDFSTAVFRGAPPTDPRRPGRDLPLLEHTVWWLTGWYPRTVLRNGTWWDSIGWPQAELFWAQVVSGREAVTAATGVLDVDMEDGTIQHVGGWAGRS